MTDFFGGILDDIRGVGDDVFDFFDSSLGKALGKGVIGLTKKDEKEGSRGSPSLSEGFVATGSGEFSPRSRGADLTSEDFASAEVQWLKRLQRFAGLNTGTEVKLGGS